MKTLLTAALAIGLIGVTVHAGSVVGTVKVNIGTTHTDTSATAPTGGAAAKELYTDNLILQGITAGAGANQGNMFWPKTAGIAASTTITNDIFGGNTDSFGQTVNAAETRFLFISSASTNLMTIDVTWTPYITNAVVRPGGAIILWAPDATAYAASAGTADEVVIQNLSTNASSYSLILMGSGS